MSTDLSKTSNLMQSRPSFLSTQKPMGVEDFKKFIRPPRVKIIQPQTKGPLKESFNEGDLVLLPQNQLIAPVLTNEKGKSLEEGTPFHFIPLFFFPEWCAWNPYQLKGQLDAIRERTFDPASKLANKARNKDLWLEPCPEDRQFNIRNCEHLNFIIMFVDDNELKGSTAVISYLRGSWSAGSTLLSLINTRNADIFACVFEGKATFKKNEQGEWYVVQPQNPAPSSGVSPWSTNDEKVYFNLRDMHQELVEAHKSSLIQVEHDEDEIEDMLNSTKY